MQRISVWFILFASPDQALKDLELQCLSRQSAFQEIFLFHAQNVSGLISASGRGGRAAIPPSRGPRRAQRRSPRAQCAVWHRNFLTAAAKGARPPHRPRFHISQLSSFSFIFVHLMGENYSLSCAARLGEWELGKHFAMGNRLFHLDHDPSCPFHIAAVTTSYFPLWHWSDGIYWLEQSERHNLANDLKLTARDEGLCVGFYLLFCRVRRLQVEVLEGTLCSSVFQRLTPT